MTTNTRAKGIDWMTIRDCSCKGAGCIESDYDPGTFYPCATCNPDWCRIPNPPTLATHPIQERDADG